MRLYTFKLISNQEGLYRFNMGDSYMGLQSYKISFFSALIRDGCYSKGNKIVRKDPNILTKREGKM